MLLRHQLAHHRTHEQHDHQRRIAATEKTIADLLRRQDNLMQEREAQTVDTTDDISRAWAERLRARFADLEHQRRTKQAELDELHKQCPCFACPAGARTASTQGPPAC